MTTYMSHGTHCDTCNHLAHTAHTTAVETGRAYHETVCIGNTIHHTASINNGKTNRTTGDKKETK